MASNLTHLKLLQFAVRLEYDCDAVYRQTVPVHETVDGKTIWQGDVEVFELKGHPKAKVCYAWWVEDWDPDRRFVAVLEKTPVSSAEMAVKAAIFFNAQQVKPVLEPSFIHEHAPVESIVDMIAQFEPVA